MKRKFKYKLWKADRLTEDGKIREDDIEAQLVCRFIDIREEKGITQKELAEMSGVFQPAIARLENLHGIPRLHTFVKLLKPMGYTIGIVPVEEADNDE